MTHAIHADDDQLSSEDRRAGTRRPQSVVSAFAALSTVTVLLNPAGHPAIGRGMARPFYSGVIPAVLSCALASCVTGSFADGVYRDARTAYRVGPLDASWSRFGLSGGDVAFRHASGGAILANAVCEGIKDVPLDVLTNQALMGVEQKQEHAREVVTLDGRAALRTRISAALDGVPIELDLVVTKKDGCTYDFELVSGVQVFAEREADFWRFVQGFKQLPRVN